MFFSLMVVVLVGLLITSCRIPKKYEYSARYILEVGNNAVESAKVRIFVGGQDFKDMATGVRTPPGSGSGIISLGSGERSMFEMSLHGPKDSLEDNDLVRSFRRVGFFEDKTESPYKSYDYAPVGCRDVPPGADCSDDAWVHQRADGTEEVLFVESPDRPFYLERDREDPDLARIVITFVPEASAGSVDALN